MRRTSTAWQGGDNPVLSIGGHSWRNILHHAANYRCRHVTQTREGALSWLHTHSWAWFLKRKGNEWSLCSKYSPTVPTNGRRHGPRDRAHRPHDITVSACHVPPLLANAACEPQMREGFGSWRKPGQPQLFFSFDTDALTRRADWVVQHSHETPRGNHVCLSLRKGSRPNSKALKQPVRSS